MEMKKSLDTFIIIGDKKQLVYYAEKPKASFPVNEQIINGKTVLKPTTKPTWSKIFIEIPTRPIEITNEWINNGQKRDILLYIVDGERTVDKWLIQGAVVTSWQLSKSRVCCSEIVRAVIQYDWARNQPR